MAGDFCAKHCSERRTALKPFGVFGMACAQSESIRIFADLQKSKTAPILRKLKKIKKTAPMGRSGLN